MCVECDKDWKNCTEAPGSPKIRLNSLPSRSNGTITEPTGTTGAGRTTTTTGGGTKLDN
jgi:hypothetical protein